jgi:hypothetical protein
MGKEIEEVMFARVLNNRCPISDLPIKGEETEIAEYNEAKLVVIKRFIKLKRLK